MGGRAHSLLSFPALACICHDSRWIDSFQVFRLGVNHPLPFQSRHGGPLPRSVQCWSAALYVGLSDVFFVLWELFWVVPCFANVVGRVANVVGRASCTSNFLVHPLRFFLQWVVLFGCGTDRPRIDTGFWAMRMPSLLRIWEIVCLPLKHMEGGGR